MGEDGGDVEASRALDVHEVGVWRLYETLELMASGLGGGRGVQKVDGKLRRLLVSITTRATSTASDQRSTLRGSRKHP